jgi:hypothetical protein
MKETLKIILSTKAFDLRRPSFPKNRTQAYEAMRVLIVKLPVRLLVTARLAVSIAEATWRRISVRIPMFKKPFILLCGRK